MKPVAQRMNPALALAIGVILAAGPALAEKPSWAGKGGNNQHREQKGERRDNGGSPGRDRNRAAPEQRRHFEDQHRVAVRQYFGEHYGEQYGGRRCPPGLAKKHNGCMPPGQAKKWQVGRPLPSNVIYYDVPPQLVVQIGAPPPGYRYARVAGDILLLAIGTGMVIDAIQDLGR